MSGRNPELRRQVRKRMQGEVDLIWVILRIAPIVISLAYVIWSGNKQTNQLSKQTDYLRRQIFGEIYDKAQIRNLQFYLRAKGKHSVVGFEEKQEEKELPIGKEISATKEKVAEVHVQFWLDAPQRIRAISWGFKEKEEYPTPPSVLDYKRAFVVRSESAFEREIYQDWHGYWHIEFPFPRFIPKDTCMVVCFTIKGSNEGQFPLDFGIATEEAKDPYREDLWVRVEG